jgi:hypothetical protein
MPDAVPLPDDRPLSTLEGALVRWMLEHGSAEAAQYLTQLESARVVSRCPCGCASVDFAIEGKVPPPGEPIGILADFEYRTPEEHLCGAFVFEKAGKLAGLEVWSIDGLAIPSTLPAIEQLRPLIIARKAEPSDAMDSR